ncbi:unannotated protein [freshwater metagenome]|uniref:Unannotated protein n=1 Tax=freshwater metagenome TaxID=449393 RepID=A0A6J7DXU6_9ZZZZ
MLGIMGARCGSLASSGLPVAVFAPDTAHEFDPMPGPVGPSQRLSSSDDARSRCSGAMAGCGTWAEEPCELLPPNAFASKTPLTTVPEATMGRCLTYGYGGKSFSVSWTPTDADMIER